MSSSSILTPFLENNCSLHIAVNSPVVSHQEEDEESLDYPVNVEFVDQGNNSSDTEAFKRVR